MIDRLLRLIGFRPKDPSAAAPTDPGLRPGGPVPGPVAIPDQPSIPASARASLSSHLSRAPATTEISFHKARIGVADSFVCGLCSAVIVKASSPGAAYQLADHRREHAQRGDLR